jgi:outer membrane lipoprotein carrier protein
MRFNRLALILATLLLSAPAYAVEKPEVKEVVQKMQAFYAKTVDLKSKFKQVYTDTLYNRKRTSYGSVLVKKPGMMRWDYHKPERKSFIADGKVLWVWEPRDKQAFRNPLSVDTLSTGLTFLLGKGDLNKEFDVSYATDKKDQLGGPDDLVLKLKPHKRSSQFEYLLMAIDPTDYKVSESMVVNRHNRNHFAFSDVTINAKLADKQFRFRPPKDTRIIDGSKLKR